MSYNNSIWITRDEYEHKVRPTRLASVMKKIEEEYKDEIIKSKKTEKESGMLLIHPTEETLSLEYIADRNPTFKRVWTAITNGIDIFEMHHHHLATRMTDGGKADNERRLLGGISTCLGQSGIAEKLRQLVERVVWHGETFGWVPIQDIEGEVPNIPRDYVIAKLIPSGEVIVRDYNNQPCRIVFLCDPDTTMRPRSTVSYMTDKCQVMDFLRQQYLQLIFYSSKPAYIASYKTDDEEKGKGDKLLDAKLANQSRINEELETMVSQTVRSTRFANTPQQRTTLGGNIYSFVSGLGSKHIQEKRERETLERKIEELQQCLEQCNQNSKIYPPFRWVLPEHLEAAGTHLQVQPFDILALERRHDMDWMVTSIGSINGVEASQNHNRTGTDRRGALDMMLLARKQKMYCQSLVYGILDTWMRNSGIFLAVPDFERFENIGERCENVGDVTHESKQ